MINDGEMGKANWITYLYERITGVEMRPIKVEGSILPPSRDRQAFPGAYARQDALDEAATRGSMTGDEDEESEFNGIVWVCTGPLAYDRAAIDRDIANLKAALEGKDVVDAFMPVVAPASAYWLRERALRDRGGVRLRARRRAARGVQGDRRRRLPRCRSTTPC